MNDNKTNLAFVNLIFKKNIKLFHPVQRLSSDLSIKEDPIDLLFLHNSVYILDNKSSPLFPYVTSSSLDYIKVTFDICHKFLAIFKPSFQSGPDGILTLILKLFSFFLSEILYQFFPYQYH